MNDTITFYYYTAWDGFAWQGCDEATAKSLQGYLEATRTLPRSSADVPPFGGAVPCKISGRIGVAVYRYHTRRKGDLSGRDSLYIALAFIPLDVGCVDFSALLGVPQLAMPQPGELHPEAASVNGLGLRLEGVGEEPGGWLDSDSAAERFSVLRGRDGLRRLSVLFFSKYTQLGFLNAVFQSENGIEGLVSTQTYRVYPEVANVVGAAVALREARRDGGGVLERGHVAVRKMNEALDRLGGWCDRQRGYAGLREYHEEKKLELNDDSEKIRLVSNYAEDLDRMLRMLPDEDRVRRKGMDADGEDRTRRCVEFSRKIAELPVLDHESYKAALRRSIDGMCRSSKLMGASECGRLAARAESELRTCRLEVDVKEREIKGLKACVEKLTRQLEKCGNRSREFEMKQGLRSELILDSARGNGKSASFGVLTWILAIIVSLLLSYAAIVVIKNMVAKNGNVNRNGGYPVKSAWARGIAGMANSSNAVPRRVKNVKASTVSNAVPTQAKGVKGSIVAPPISNAVDRVRLDKSGNDVRPDGNSDLKKRNPDGSVDVRPEKLAKTEKEIVE